MRTLRRLILILALCSQLSALSYSCRATELTDLGEGLAYLRVHAFDGSAKALTSALRERDALVLDLRHIAITAESAALLQAALAGRKTPALPLFVLVGPATPPDFVTLLTTPSNKCLTLGVKESVPLPRVIIDQPAATDQLAYEAFESGQPLASLISGKINKERFDEAALMKEFNSGNINASSPTPPDPTIQSSALGRPPAKPTAKPETTPVAKLPELPAANKAEPLIDRVLQRAIHLHRAMGAIKPR